MVIYMFNYMYIIFNNQISVLHYSYEVGYKINPKVHQHEQIRKM